VVSFAHGKKAGHPGRAVRIVEEDFLVLKTQNNNKYNVHGTCANKPSWWEFSAKFLGIRVLLTFF